MCMGSVRAERVVVAVAAGPRDSIVFNVVVAGTSSGAYEVDMWQISRRGTKA